ncbi:hypothetical protein GCM10009767_06620 [Kocuria aegyptia]|uniref:Uncharacterized protein n=1 Tax=Kocuria aegyptia TaxID=330943 RepID=A0ABN2K8B2_9MICC
MKNEQVPEATGLTRTYGHQRTPRLSRYGSVMHDQQSPTEDIGLIPLAREAAARLQEIVNSGTRYDNPPVQESGGCHCGRHVAKGRLPPDRWLLNRPAVSLVVLDVWEVDNSIG